MDDTSLGCDEIIGKDDGDDFNKPSSGFNKSTTDFNEPQRQMHTPAQPAQQDTHPIRSPLEQLIVGMIPPDADPEVEQQLRRSILWILGTLFCGGLYFFLHAAFVL